MAKSKKTKAHGSGETSPPVKVPPIVAATVEYEHWLRERVGVVESDLRQKYTQMRKEPFAFLRATFYRWSMLWPQVCPGLADAPELLAIGDLHVENFGTWRDLEGRLVWGINDFDEVAEMPYTIDLVRLVTSVILAKRQNELAIDAEHAAEAVLEGYTQWLETGGDPFILEESHPGLRAMAMSAERDPIKFWSNLKDSPQLEPPKRVRRLLDQSLPGGLSEIRFLHRVAGIGSLGRPRYVEVACCNGGKIAREVKAWLPSAWGWARGRVKKRAYSVRMLKHAVRQPDPYYSVEAGWVVRRIGPHCGRIELGQFPKRRDERLILRDMGRETANMHLASPKRRDKILRDLADRKPGWLVGAARAMAEATEQDWESFRTSQFACDDSYAEKEPEHGR
jgi:hypothetical protein